MSVIRVEQLCKRYADTLAVDDLSFSVQPGEVYALLGENGAGKSTSVEILEGIARPTPEPSRCSADPRGTRSGLP